MSLKSNPYIKLNGGDFLYHLGIDTSQVNCKEIFHDVKFVCLGGSTNRMLKFAKFINENLNGNSEEPYNYAYKTDRYCLYKTGPILIANHGIGVPSLSVLLNEIFKLLFYAQCSDVIFIRLGTCGGIGVEAGTVVITDNVVNGELEPIFSYVSIKLGKRINITTTVDADLVREIYDHSSQNNSFTIVRGTTCSVDCFYEAQGRLDGALCDYTEEDRKQFFEKLQRNGVKNLEMESLGLFSYCHRAGYKAAMIAVALLNRLEADEPTSNIDMLKEWESRPFYTVLNFIRSKLDIV
ncbi:hypothetical protein LOTGIDRAFT_115900 [Lottia gigantea]|uniref:Nucleoside phosphorylase domain-containing protein n=1 Tax=Lottia gigantea TaxID=225164 RepID=V4AI22_LOTGI|nr:hypothetical protein LOTGIDRAFT_115900 [Lottia gigantea]ESO96562.1 hypothetical protein LOTGIDRAFT_115900 [Lottia gigantea]